MLPLCLYTMLDIICSSTFKALFIPANQIETNEKFDYKSE
jgi:hypothetical protein